MNRHSWWFRDSCVEGLGSRGRVTPKCKRTWCGSWLLHLRHSAHRRGACPGRHPPLTGCRSDPVSLSAIIVAINAQFSTFSSLLRKSAFHPVVPLSNFFEEPSVTWNFSQRWKWRPDCSASSFTQLSKRVSATVAVMPVQESTLHTLFSSKAQLPT